MIICNSTTEVIGYVYIEILERGGELSAGGGHQADHLALGTGITGSSHLVGALGDSITGNCVTQSSLSPTIVTLSLIHI